jgi:ABC-type branched-subunit amino acid transport system substrate-binding protein
MRSSRLTIVAIVALALCPAGDARGQAKGQPAPGPATPTGPVLRLGALLPMTGPGAWFGAEIKQGLELAAAGLDPGSGNPASEKEPKVAARTRPLAPDRAGDLPGRDASPTPAASADEKESKVARSARPLAPDRAGDLAKAATPEQKKAGGRPPTDSVEPADRPRGLTLAIQAQDLQPLDVHDAQAELGRLLGSGVAAVVTASPTPTLTVLPLAAARDVLVLHAGLPGERFPASSRTLLQLRPSAAARADILGRFAWERGIRRLALLASGDGFGRAVRAAMATRWRQQGGQLAHDESVLLDAPDLRSRLRAVARVSPEAVALGFQGTALGEAARALRDAGYSGPIVAMDDDRAVLLSGGRALEGALLLADAFVPVPGSRGARFARAYEGKYGRPPSRFAANAYEVAMLLVEAADRVRGEARGVSGSRLRDALGGGRKFPSLYAGDLTVRDDGTIGRPLALFRVEGERLKFETYVDVDGRILETGNESKP